MRSLPHNTRLNSKTAQMGSGRVKADTGSAQKPNSRVVFAIGHDINHGYVLHPCLITSKAKSMEGNAFGMAVQDDPTISQPTQTHAPKLEKKLNPDLSSRSAKRPATKMTQLFNMIQLPKLSKDAFSPVSGADRIKEKQVFSCGPLPTTLFTDQDNEVKVSKHSLGFGCS
ncbi:hypothetical protein FRC02_006663 [Tulasnella sp. 418]|nr:hypothetical protein FRC02_006663 [Tulasnella sp. 418]